MFGWGSIDWTDYRSYLIVVLVALIARVLYLFLRSMLLDDHWSAPPDR